MSIVVTLLGVLAIVIGGLATAYGFVINEFSLGNTLLIVGALGIVGGLLLIGIGAAIRQLRLIAEALRRQPLRIAREMRAPRPAGDARGAAMARAAGPLSPKRAREAAAVTGVRPEPKLDTPASPPLERTAAESAPTAIKTPSEAAPAPQPPILPASEPAPIAPSLELPPTVEKADVPLSPGELTPQPMSEAQAERQETAEPSHVANAPEATTPVEDRRSAAVSRAEPTDWLGADDGLGFDTMWPKRERPAEDTAKPPARKAAAAASAEDAPQPESFAPNASGATESAPESEHEEGTPAEAAAPERPEPHAVSILKSGVVDGMAYTLYSDGSIEAQLPSGTIHFASIKELREHLERTD